MKRTTVVLPDELAALVELERRRRNVSATEVIREALVSYLTGEGAPEKKLPFAALGRSGRRDTARRAEEILGEEWGRASGS